MEHSEESTPSGGIGNSKKRDDDRLDTGKGTGDRDHKRPRRPNPNNWNPALKSVLEGPLQQAGYPTFTKLLKFCKGSSYEIYPRGSPICAPNAFFGRCFHGEQCLKQHVMAKEDEVPKILKMVKPFIDNPTWVNAGL